MPGSAMAVPLAVPQHLVELELRRVKGAEYPLVEAADLVLVHGLGGVAVQGDPLVVQGQVPVQVARVPAMLFTRVRHRFPGRITRYPSASAGPCQAPAYFTCCDP